MRGLYAIADTSLLHPAQLIEAVAQAIAGGAVMIQYRDKSVNPALREKQARALRALCHNHGVLLIINDDIALASAAQADGVHLGRDDAPLETARRRLGGEAIIGISCYNDLARAIAAQRAGADYVAFGRFFASGTKPDAAVAEVDLLRQAKQILTIPVVAIGGITPENGTALITAGADLLAVIRGVFDTPDVEDAARKITRNFESQAACQSFGSPPR